MTATIFAVDDDRGPGAEVKMIPQQKAIIKLRSDVQEAHAPEHLVGSSPAMEQLRHLIRRAASSDATVLVVGESGTGKELVARALHDASLRAKGPFVDVNSAALTETLIESAFFGHERGAFTTAISRQRGKFEQADGGTLFLDEIGDMPLSTQAKMLRVLQERSFERVGGEAKISVDVRVICATNRNLEESVRKGSFRVDLFYRVNMLVMEVPPLREHKADIPELVRYFLSRAGRLDNCRAQDISAAALELVSRHDWPGNIRELKNAIERSLILCNEDKIQPFHLPPAVLRGPVRFAQATGGRTSKTLLAAVRQLERSMILSTLEKCRWERGEAARVLGVTRRVLSYKMQNLEIEKSVREH